MNAVSYEDMCSECDGLCCRVYDIIDSETGTIIKRAWVPCEHLDRLFRCRKYQEKDVLPGYKESCSLYDCFGAWPIVTIFARRIPQDSRDSFALISSLLETVRLQIIEEPESRDTILTVLEKELQSILIDESLPYAIKSLRAKIPLL